MLGDLMTSLTDEATALETIMGAGDLKLLAAARGTGRRRADSILRPFVTQTVQRYASEASDEEWLTLMGLLNRSQDPGATCIKRALEHALRG